MFGEKVPPKIVCCIAVTLDLRHFKRCSLCIHDASIRLVYFQGHTLDMTVISITFNTVYFL